MASALETSQHKCCRRVGTHFSGRGCRLPGVVQIGEKWYCKRHTPDAERARKEARQARWDAEHKQRQDYYAKQEAERRALIRDAARYRWLREARFLEIVTETQMFRCSGGDELDRVVDTAATP